MTGVTFDEECIYLYEESEKCKFGGMRERKLCMFKHENMKDDEDENSDDEECDDDEGSESETETNEDIKPILEQFKKAVENFEELLQKCSLKCKQCDFEAS